MFDMKLVRDLIPDHRLRSAEELSAIRGRLAMAMAHEGEAAPESKPSRSGSERRRHRARSVWAGFATAGLAAGIAAAVSAALILAPDTVGGEVPAAHAADVLNHAAVTARTQPDLAPRPDQFVYQRQTGGYESWMSVDGTHDGLIRVNGNTMLAPGCRDGRRAVMRGDQVVGSESCDPEPAYLSDLPTDVNGMLAYLEQIRSGEPGDVNAVGKDILFLLSAHVLRPGTKAALFEAAATMSGLTVVPDVNVAGRSGVGIAWSYDGKTGMIIFDSATYDYLGVQAGYGQSMVLDVAIVDEAGRRP